MGNWIYVLILAVVATLWACYANRDKLKRRATKWLHVDPVKGDISYVLSESTTTALEEVRRKLQKKYPGFELVSIQLSAGRQRTILDKGSMSKEELRRSGENGYDFYGRLIDFKISIKVNNDVTEVTARSRVESNKPGIWKAAFVELDGASSQTGHPQKLETPVAAEVPRTETKKAIDLDDVPSLEEVMAETGRDVQLSILPADEEAPAADTTPAKAPEATKPRPTRRRRSANAIGAMSEV